VQLLLLFLLLYDVNHNNGGDANIKTYIMSRFIHIFSHILTAAGTTKATLVQNIIIL